MIHPLTFLKGAGLGAGMMYFFDPVAGNRRRALVRDQIISAFTTCGREAAATYRDAGNRLQGAKSEIRSAIQASDKQLQERVIDATVGAGRTLGVQGQRWSPTAKAAAMLGGVGLLGSLMRKRDLAALAFGAVGLSYMTKELADREKMRTQRSSKRQESGRKAAEAVDSAGATASVTSKQKTISNL